MSIKKSAKEIRSIILENVLLMIERRGLISSDMRHGIFKDFKKDLGIVKDTDNRKLYIIDEIIAIYVFDGTLSSIKDNSAIIDEVVKVKLPVIFISNKFFQKGISGLVKKKPNVEFFEISDFMFDITKYPLVPHHEGLSDEESKEVLKLYSKEEIQQMEYGDKIRVYYGFKVGQVVKIYRNSPVSLRSIAYRLVIPPK